LIKTRPGVGLGKAGQGRAGLFVHDDGLQAKAMELSSASPSCSVASLVAQMGWPAALRPPARTSHRGQAFPCTSLPKIDPWLLTPPASCCATLCATCSACSVALSTAPWASSPSPPPARSSWCHSPTCLPSPPLPPGVLPLWLAAVVSGLPLWLGCGCCCAALYRTALGCCTAVLVPSIQLLTNALNGAPPQLFPAAACQ